jgi:hypothetical protein
MNRTQLRPQRLRLPTPFLLFPTLSLTLRVDLFRSLQSKKLSSVLRTAWFIFPIPAAQPLIGTDSSGCV